MPATATKIARKPRTTKAAPARFVRLLLAPTADAPGLIAIAVGSDRAPYWIEPLPADFDGPAFGLRKLRTTEVYHVAAGAAPSCTCKGYSYRAKCKHVDATLALLRARKLMPAAPSPAPAPQPDDEPESDGQPEYDDFGDDGRHDADFDQYD